MPSVSISSAPSTLDLICHGGKGSRKCRFVATSKAQLNEHMKEHNTIECLGPRCDRDQWYQSANVQHINDKHREVNSGANPRLIKHPVDRYILKAERGRSFHFEHDQPKTHRSLASSHRSRALFFHHRQFSLLPIRHQHHYHHTTTVAQPFPPTPRYLGETIFELWSGEWGFLNAHERAAHLWMIGFYEQSARVCASLKVEGMGGSEVPQRWMLSLLYAVPIMGCYSSSST